MKLQQVIESVMDRKHVDIELLMDCMKDIINGIYTPTQISAFLVCLRVVEKDPIVIASLAKLMREHAIRVKVNASPLMDTCGTGGDEIKTINVSTATGLVVASCGAKVAKHGNRSFTGYSGSADFLEWIGVNINADPDVVKRCIENVGFGFIFAPTYHPAMKNVAQVRRELAIRTTFNIIGPLANPAIPDRQAIGVFSEEYLETIAKALRILGVERAAVYHGIGGMDEVSPFSDTVVAWLDEFDISIATLKPEDFGIRKVKVEDIIVRDRDTALKKTLMALVGRLNRHDPIESLLLVNSSIALMVAGIADDLKHGVELSWDAISSGAVEKKIVELVKESGGDLRKFEERLNELS